MTKGTETMKEGNKKCKRKKKKKKNSGNSLLNWCDYRFCSIFALRKKKKKKNRHKSQMYTIILKFQFIVHQEAQQKSNQKLPHEYQSQCEEK